MIRTIIQTFLCTLYFGIGIKVDNNIFCGTTPCINETEYSNDRCVFNLDVPLINISDNILLTPSDFV